MKIIIEIESKKDFHPQTLVDVINDRIGSNADFWARLIGVEPEDDEND